MYCGCACTIVRRGNLVNRDADPRRQHLIWVIFLCMQRSSFAGARCLCLCAYASARTARAIRAERPNLRDILAVVRRTLDVVFEQVAARANVEDAGATFYDLVEIGDGRLIQVDEAVDVNI